MTVLWEELSRKRGAGSNIWEEEATRLVARAAGRAVGRRELAWGNDVPSSVSFPLFKEVQGCKIERAQTRLMPCYSPFLHQDSGGRKRTLAPAFPIAYGAVQELTV